MDVVAQGLGTLRQEDYQFKVSLGLLSQFKSILAYKEEIK